MKLSKAAATLPLPLDYPVKTMDDWLKIKPFYQFTQDRLQDDWQADANKSRKFIRGSVATVQAR